MTVSRIALSSLGVLAIAACAPGEAEEGDSGRSPIGYELAMAKAGPEGMPAQEEPDVVDLSAEDLRKRIEAGNVRLVDVRTDEEVAQGTIPGAEHIPLDDFDPAQLDLDDDREVILYCRSGRRSGMAAEKLAAFTGRPAEHLAGGIIAWKEAGGEIEVP